MDKLINFLKGRETKRESAVVADFGAPKLARIGALQGKLLLSTLKIQEHIFAKTIIFVASHNENGAMGLIVNRKIEGADSREVIEGLGVRYPKFSFKKPKFDLFHGGPIEEMRGFVLHSSDYKTPNSVLFANGIAITAERQILTDAVRGRGPEHMIMAMGYTGWMRGQLEAEIDDGAWIAIPASEQLVFVEDNSRKWQAAADSQNINLMRLVPEPSYRVS